MNLYKKRTPYYNANNRESNQSSITSLAQWKQLCKQAYDEILEVCENGSLRDLINLEAEIRSEKTNNKRDLYLIHKAMDERFDYV